MTLPRAPGPGRDRRATARYVVFAVLTTALVLGGLNAGIEWLERAGVISTLRPDDRLAPMPERLYFRRGRSWVASSSPSVPVNPASFPVDKGDAWRVFVTGASFAYGTPYGEPIAGAEERLGGIPTWLRAMLGARYPGRPIEVINASVGGASAASLVPVIEELVGYEPDLILLATCNNEGSLSTEGLRAWLTGFGGYRALRNLVQAPAERGDRPYFVVQHPATEEVREQFEAVLGEMVATAERASVPLLLATLPVNLRYAGAEPGPIIDVPVRSTWGCGEVVELLGEGRYEEGLAKFGACEGVTDVAPWEGLALLRLGRIEEGRRALGETWGSCLAEGVTSWFASDHVKAIDVLATCEDTSEALRWLGLAHHQLGEHERARVQLEQAVELRPRNRCRPSFNGYIRVLAEGSSQATLVDLDQHARALSPGGLPGPELFVDYCHMNWWGYGLMAQEILRVIEASPAAPPWPAAGVELDLYRIMARWEADHPGL